ncbi:thioredoxin domain-containing protein [Frisingicoccus sp.]|uniref:thioredoxin domain-containing protein n=1 Tax=Frisingicoccus sp. TaxID=1918627 RepID=UPI00399A1DCD
MSNRLKNEKSPYLLQHGDNPVDWYPWGDEAFKKAADENKPVFLSIGYSTCHWCHVMAHESFEDEKVAELLNKNFISIKVDREERPDIDAVYMSVCQALTGAGGWPLTIIMTPEQKPFFAGTYFPKGSRYGQPGLTDILIQVAALWQTRRKELEDNAEMIIDAIVRNGREESGISGTPDKSILAKAYTMFQEQFDRKWGGFGTAPKFPTPHHLLFLMRYAEVEKAPEALKMVEITLEAMARGGIHDHIGGGFSRYSTDKQWLVPHFEKMLYDNALLLWTNAEAYRITRKELYGAVARDIADYMLRELADGGFYCGQDADSDGVEGKYYVFTPEEVKAVLGDEDGEEFCYYYHITDRGNFEGKSIPNTIGNPAEDISDLERHKIWKKQLYDYRLERTRLHKDDKILLSWNAWAIIALVRAGDILGEPSCLEAAVRTKNFIEEKMIDGNQRLYLRFRDGEAANAGQLDDYAVYALALLELYQATFEIEYLSLAVLRAKQMRELFEDREKGGYYMTAFDGETLISRPKETYDGAIPSGNSVAVMVLQKLALLTAERTWQEAAERQMRFCAGEIQRYPVGYSFALMALTMAFYPHRELVCAVKERIPEELKQYVSQYGADDISVLVKTEKNEEELLKYAPFTAEYPVPETEPAYYLCENGTCKMPVTSEVVKTWILGNNPDIL